MQRFRNILVVCDKPSTAQVLLERVQWLASINTAKVTLVDMAEARPGDLSRVFSDVAGQSAEEIEQQVLDIYQARLEELAQPLRATGIKVRTAVEQGSASLQIIRRVLRDGHDLLIKNEQREEGWPFLHGLDMQLLRKCPCPVWILDAPGEPRARRILAAVDTMSDDPTHEALNRTVMDLATSLARQDQAQLDVISVWNLQEESSLRHVRVHMPEAAIEALIAAQEARSARRLETLMQQFPGDAARLRVLHVKGRPASTIIRHVEEEKIDTIVMGTLARVGIAGFVIGNTAETILSRVTCSVLAVKPEGFVSPVEMGAVLREATLA